MGPSGDYFGQQELLSRLGGGMSVGRPGRVRGGGQLLTGTRFNEDHGGSSIQDDLPLKSRGDDALKKATDPMEAEETTPLYIGPVAGDELSPSNISVVLLQHPLKGAHTPLRSRMSPTQGKSSRTI